MRIHIAAAAVAIVCGLVLGISAVDWRWVALAIALVLAAETFNTAIEQACNALGGGHNENVRVAKDVAAGAVLMCCGLALVIGVFVFVPYLQLAVSADAWDLSNGPMCGSIPVKQIIGK